MTNRKLNNYILISLISIVFGVIYYSAIYLGGILTSILTPLGLGVLGFAPFYGIWTMAPIVSLHLIRKPFVGIITALIASLIEVLLGSMFSWIVIISGLLYGVAIELIFAIYKYKDYSYKTTIIASIATTILSFPYTVWAYGYYELEVKIIFLIYIIQLVSTIIFTGLLAKYLCNKIEDTGAITIN